MSAVGDSLSISNGGAGAAASGRLVGGKYGLVWKATGSGTITVSVLAPDNSTWVPAFTASTATSGYQIVDLIPGQCQITSTGFTGVYAALVRCGDD